MLSRCLLLSILTKNSIFWNVHCLSIHSWNNGFKGSRNSQSCFSTNFHKSKALICGPFSTFLGWNLFIWHVNFVPKNHYDYFAISIVCNLLVPRFHCIKTIRICHIINEKGSDTFFEKDRCESFKFFLAESVPNMQLAILVSLWDWVLLSRPLNLCSCFIFFIESIINMTSGNTRFAYHFIPY